MENPVHPSYPGLRRLFLIIAILLLTGLACELFTITIGSPSTTPPPAVVMGPTDNTTPWPAIDTPTAASAESTTDVPPTVVPPPATLELFTCNAQPAVANLLDQTTKETWIDWDMNVTLE